MSSFVELGSVVKIKGRIGWKGYKKTDLRESGPVVIGGTNVKNSINLDLSDLKFLSQEKYLESPEIILKKGDVLLVQRGNGIGDVSYYDGQFKEATINPTMIILSDFQGDSRYLFYYLVSKQGQNEILSRSSGSSIPAIYQGPLATIDIPLPKFEIQKQIADVLQAYDQKTHLLRQQNTTLESMAQALFKSWFVDFDPVIDNALAAGRELPEALAGRVAKRRAVLDGGDYPVLPEEVRGLFPAGFWFSEMLGRWVPEGWGAGPVSAYADVVGGGTPSRKNEDYFTKNGIPWLSPKDLSGYEWKYISGGANDVSEAGLKNSSAKMLPVGTVLFSSRAPIGYIAIASKELCTNQGFKSLVPHHQKATDYLYHYLKRYTPDLEAIATGSTFKEVSGGALKRFEILMPTLEVLDTFCDLLAPWNEKATVLQEKVGTLTRLRDVLLPELISGRVGV